MKLLVLVLLGACTLVKTTSTTSTPVAPSTGGNGGGGTAEYKGDDAMWVPSLMHYTKAEAEEMLATKGFKGQIVSTGDTDPQYARDEMVCEQTPADGKMSPNGVMTLKYCNTYVKPKTGPVLVGLTIDAAKAKIKANGFDGEVEVEQAGSLAGCASKSVCSVDPEMWWLNQDHRMTLYWNPY